MQLLDGQPVGHHNRNLPQPAAALGGRRAAALRAVVARRRQMMNGGGGGGSDAEEHSEVMPPLFAAKSAASGGFDNSEDGGRGGAGIEALEPDEQFAAAVLLHESWKQADVPFQPFLPQVPQEPASLLPAERSTTDESFQSEMRSPPAVRQGSAPAAVGTSGSDSKTRPRTSGGGGGGRRRSSRAERLERISRTSSWGTASRRLEPAAPPASSYLATSQYPVAVQHPDSTADRKPRSSSMSVQPADTQCRRPSTACAAPDAVLSPLLQANAKPILGLRTLPQQQGARTSSGRSRSPNRSEAQRRRLSKHILHQQEMSFGIEPLSRPHTAPGVPLSCWKPEVHRKLCAIHGASMLVLVLLILKRR